MGRKLMLRELKIENLAIIDELDIEFDKGFIVLTGETGAGKSIILSGINLLIGEKASVDMIRDGEENLVAQGVFDVDEEQKKALEAMGIDIDGDEIIIRRSYSRSGKARAFVNNVRISLTDLKEIASTLVDIVGQHSHQMLLNKNNHIKLLDSFLNKDEKDLKENLVNLLSQYREIDIKIENIEKERKETLEKKEFYEYQLEEIEKLKLKDGEDELLEAEYKRVFNAEKIREKVYESLEYLKDDEDSALSLITNSIRNIEYLGKYDERYIELAKRMENTYYELEDCASEIENISKGIDVTESDLDKIAGRMNILKRIKEKYKRTLPELIAYREYLKEKLSDIDSGDFKTKELKKELNKIKTEYDKIAEKMTNSRKEIAIKIENELLNELKFLNMEDAKLKVQINKLERMTSEGYDDVEFFISTNVGQDLKPLNKIASGGEVSRVMLALKVIFSKVDNIPILIFDEIDTGIGGETVRKIALKLKEIGENTQIISITHSPVIASKASQQFYIEKYVENSKTISRVKKLSAEERIKEIGRMLVGEKINNEVLEIANKMLNEG
ncbi:DNA repair protein RecN [Fusobacterium sp.]|uniref:DNA repair protein RecN n=1 Tax=Fusobacterium nucleatum TaxID=851 RepID=A0A323TWE0_FUSNU|nr:MULTISPECIES: DNA repair protein RecN [Fusobacterium]PCR85901.1 DNA repair protein RecN [Fusobacterium nucleatum]PZA04885.1 DNA repair protein RecN [Fusobacterium nucleatum]QJX49957.1 DNA repair protein RecN [Fusobacterium nucleatum]HCE33508.1 DNA repair protein RecN [Fusobacterium sp.]